jgi:hypothetical protein
MPETKKTPWQEPPGLDRLPPIFARCIERENPRIDRPFISGAFIYATNGRMAVRMPVPEGGWEFPPPAKAPRGIESVFYTLSRSEPTPLPEVSSDPCKSCRGAMFLDHERKCDECRGIGRDNFPRCECPHCEGFHECRGCEGSGKLPGQPCGECRETGMGESPQEAVAIVPGYYLARVYVALLRAFEATLYLPTYLRDDAASRFMIGEVEGVILPMFPTVKEDE